MLRSAARCCSTSGLLVCGLLCGRASANSQDFDFVIDSKLSGLVATFGVTVPTTGTLIGNYDELNNPAGTRTKPGLFGSFGETENVPVNMSLTFSVTSDVNTAPLGDFHLQLDADAGTLSISGLHIDYLGSGPQALESEVTLQTDSFRTRNPSSTYIGGIPITLPLSQATLLALSAVQDSGAAPGTLTETGPGQYDFLVIVPTQSAGQVEFGGTVTPFGPSPNPVVLQGQLTLSDDTATMLSTQPLDVSNSQEVNQPLPQIPLDLPTILPPGLTAAVLLDLTVTTTQTSLQGTQTLIANGTKVVTALPGDMNCDGSVTVSDIGPFVLALTDPPAYAAQFPDCDILHGDVSGDGQVTVSDIGPFVALLTGGS